MRPNRHDAGGRKIQSAAAPSRDRPQPVGTPEAGAIGGDSPARALQGVLASRISDGFAVERQEHVERWPRHQRLLFLVGSASALWAVTIGLASIVAALIN